MSDIGIYPSGNRIVIKPDDVEEVTDGGIVIPAQIGELHQHAQTTGILVSAGPDAWSHTTKKRYRLIDGLMKLVEVETIGYSEPFAKVGDRVAFAQHGGIQLEGSDGETYRIMNDEDLTARVDENVSFTGLQSRKRVGLV